MKILNFLEKKELFFSFETIVKRVSLSSNKEFLAIWSPSYHGEGGSKTVKIIQLKVKKEHLI